MKRRRIDPRDLKTKKTIPQHRSVELGQHTVKKIRAQSCSFAHTSSGFLRGIGMLSPLYSVYNLLSIIRPKNSKMFIALIPVYGFRHSPEIS